MPNTALPIAVIGAGPVGLAAAAHLLERGEEPLVFESGPKVGHAVRQWSHVRMFSPWSFNIDKAAERLLDAHGWQRPDPDELPTGGDIVARYLEPLAEIPAMRSRIKLNTRIVAVSRKAMDKVRTKGRADQPFVLRAVNGDGSERVVEAKAVIDASGTWFSPNPAGSDGLPAIGEAAAAGRIAYGIPDVLGPERARYAGKRTLVIGGGHSALNALLELAELKETESKTTIVWALRKTRVEDAYGGEAADQLSARGALGAAARHLVESGAVEVITPFRAQRIDTGCCGIKVVGDRDGEEQRISADQIIVATGFRPDLAMLRELRLTVDPWLESSGTIGPLIDPNLHSCGSVRPHGAAELAHAEPNFFIAGMKSYGRAPTFLLATGHEQVRSIAAALTGDTESAARVELCLPETGVCVTRPRGATKVEEACCDPKPEQAAAGGCCGPEKSEVAAVTSTGCCGPAKAAPAIAARSGSCCD
ncbi:MAG: NAD(P)-binding domain-containing protein [Rhodospirillales bacterium]|nr:NAD(P)-binding domain-containing protein [Rhodospirillales bacterium]